MTLKTRKMKSLLDDIQQQLCDLLSELAYAAA